MADSPGDVDVDSRTAAVGRKRPLEQSEQTSPYHSTSPYDSPDASSKRTKLDPTNDGSLDFYTEDLDESIPFFPGECNTPASNTSRNDVDPAALPTTISSQKQDHSSSKDEASDVSGETSLVESTLGLDTREAEAGEDISAQDVRLQSQSGTEMEQNKPKPASAEDHESSIAEYTSKSLDELRQIKDDINAYVKAPENKGKDTSEMKRKKTFINEATRRADYQELKTRDMSKFTSAEKSRWIECYEPVRASQIFHAEVAENHGKAIAKYCLGVIFAASIALLKRRKGEPLLPRKKLENNLLLDMTKVIALSAHKGLLGCILVTESKKSKLTIKFGLVYKCAEDAKSAYSSLLHSIDGKPAAENTISIAQSAKMIAEGDRIHLWKADTVRVPRCITLYASTRDTELKKKGMKHYCALTDYVDLTDGFSTKLDSLLSSLEANPPPKEQLDVAEQRVPKGTLPPTRTTPSEGEIQSVSHSSVDSSDVEYEPPEVDASNDSLPPLNLSGPCRLYISDLTEAERQTQNFYWNADSSNDSVHCMICSLEGHMEESCPSRVCRHCKAQDIHFAAACPLVVKCRKCREPGHSEATCSSMLIRSAADGFFCDYCKKKGHPEDKCWRVWSTYVPEDIVEPKKIATLNVSCYYCGAADHFGDDCPLDRRRKVGDRRAFSAKEAERYSIDGNWFPMTSKPRNPPVRGMAEKNRGNAGYSIKGRGKSNAAFDTRDYEEDEEDGLGRHPRNSNESRVSHPLPSKPQSKVPAMINIPGQLDLPGLRSKRSQLPPHPPPSSRRNVGSGRSGQGGSQWQPPLPDERPPRGPSKRQPRRGRGGPRR